MTLDNPQHEKFAQLVAGGMDRTQAYQRVYNDASKDSALSAGARLFGIVRPRIRFLQAQSATELVMDMQERREFLARVVRCQLHEIDFEKDGDLIQEIVRTEGTESRAGIEKLKLPGKRECIVTDAQLSGEMPDKSGPTINLTNQINVLQITEAQRQELVEKRRQANERLRKLKADRQARLLEKQGE